MTDSLGFRKKFGVIAPSTNTSVQPEFDAMRPRGVTNHFGRIHIPNDPIRNDDDFNQLMDNIRAQMMETIDRGDDLRARLPGHGHVVGDVLGRARGQPASCSERVEAARRRQGVRWARTPAQAALQVLRREAASASSRPTCRSATRRCAGSSSDCGFEVVRLKGLKCASPVLIAHVSERELRDAILEVNGPDVDAIIQVGTNLAMARLAGIAEFWLDKPVLAINTCIYWWALRQNGIDDKIEGFGSLLLEH